MICCCLLRCHFVVGIFMFRYLIKSSVTEVPKSCLIYLTVHLFTQKMLSCGYRNPHYKPKTVWHLSQVNNGNSYTNAMLSSYPHSKVHGANMEPTWVLSAPDGPRVGPMKIADRVVNTVPGVSAAKVGMNLICNKQVAYVLPRRIWWMEEIGLIIPTTELWWECRSQ